MDLNLVTKKLKAFIKKYKSQFDQIPSRQSALLELGILTLATEHYRLNNYTIKAKGTVAGKFRVKLSARGYPYNFSWFECERDNVKVEIHSNLSARGAHSDKGIYVVDVGVVKFGSVPHSPPKKKWKALKNKYLISFIEAKALVVFPMLLAQFVGIVHEILPKRLNGKRPKGFGAAGHFRPTLVTLGHLSGTSQDIIDGFKKRKIAIRILHSFEIHLANMRAGKVSNSPFTTPASGIV